MTLLERTALLPAADAPAAPTVPVAPGAGRPPRSWGWLVAVLAGQLLLLANVSLPVVRPVLGLALLVGVPVLVLSRRVFASATPLAATLYAVGATVLGAIVVPLLLNTVLPWAGVGAPLARPVLIVASTVVDLALLARRSPVPLVPRGCAGRFGRAVVTTRCDPAVAVGLLAVVLAVAGAVRLNNGLSGAVATVGHVAAIAALGLAVLRRSSMSRDVAVVYLAGLALLLGTSLRGWYITGHDIQNEYLAYLLTHDSLHWVMSAYPVAYNACLSVNILPTVVVQYLGITGVFAFKVAMQLLFAVVPIGVYASARRVVTPRLAVLSVAFFVFFPTFYTDMPYLVRQEVAYLFVVLALLATTQPGWSLRRRQAMTFVFGVGVVLSHYSTTYFLLITLFLGIVGAAAGNAWQKGADRRVRRFFERLRTIRPVPVKKLRPRLSLLGPAVVAALTLTAWLWSSPITHSNGHLAATVQQLTDEIIHGNAQASSSDLSYSVFGGGGPTAQQRLTDYLNAAVQARDSSAADQYVFPQPSAAISHPALVDRSYLPLTWLGHGLHDIGVNVIGVNSVLRGGAAALFQLLLALGLLAIVFAARSTQRLGREHFWLSLASIGALAAVVLVPGLSADYGVLRAFQQTLLFCAPLLVIGLTTVLRHLGRAAVPIGCAITLAVGAVLTGVVPALFGGYYAVLSQSNAGQYHQMLYPTPPEIAASKWIAATAGAQGPQTVAASDIVAITRLQTYVPGSVTVTGNYLPTQLQRGAYLFLGPEQVLEDQSTVFYTGDLLSYRYPTAAIAARLDLVYSTADSEIYR